MSAEVTSDGEHTSSSALVPLHGDRLPAPTVGAVELVEQAGTAALGVALLVGDGVRAVARQVAGPAALPVRPDDDPGPATATRRVAVGLADGLARGVLGVVARAADELAPTARRLAANPLVEAATAPARSRVRAAYEAGLARESEARVLATRTTERTVALAVPVVLDVVDVEAMVGRVIAEVDLRPIVERVLAELDLPELVTAVIAELDMKPIVDRVLAETDIASLVDDVLGEVRMSSVVMTATGGITTDVATQVRNRAAEGDMLVDRVVAAILRRRRAGGPGLPPIGLEAVRSERADSPVSGNEAENGDV